MGIPVIETFNTNTLGNGDTITVGKISSTQVGDLMIAIVAREGGSEPASTVSPGESWTEIVGISGGTDASVEAWYRIATTDDQQTGSYAGFVWNPTGSGDDAVAWVLRITGHDSSNPISSSVRTRAVTSSDSTITSGNGTLGFNDFLHFSAVAFDGGDGEFGVTDTSSWTHYNANRATSNTSLINDNQHLIVSTSGNSVTGAWDYYGSSVRNSDSITWSAAVTDGIAGIKWVVNGSLGATPVARTATGAGTGTSGTVIKIGRSRFATGSGGATVGDTAVGVLVAKRTASGEGNGAASSAEQKVLVRNGTGTGSSGSATVSVSFSTVSRTADNAAAGSSTSTSNFFTPFIRTASGAGAGTASSTAVGVRPRTATGFGGATGGDTATGFRIAARTGTASGVSTSASLWYKTLVFRPPVDDDFPWADYRNNNIRHRLFGYFAQGQRARNVYKLVDGTFTTVDPLDGTVVLTYLGGHQYNVTQSEKDDLVAAGYEVT